MRRFTRMHLVKLQHQTIYTSAKYVFEPQTLLSWVEWLVRYTESQPEILIKLLITFLSGIAMTTNLTQLISIEVGKYLSRYTFKQINDYNSYWLQHPRRIVLPAQSVSPTYVLGALMARPTAVINKEEIVQCYISLCLLLDFVISHQPPVTPGETTRNGQYQHYMNF